MINQYILNVEGNVQNILVAPAGAIPSLVSKKPLIFYWDTDLVQEKQLRVSTPLFGDVSVVPISIIEVKPTLKAHVEAGYLSADVFDLLPSD